jgi:hypothetical protein
LTPEERDVAIAPFGFSKRQTRFLDLVMRHSGVCVPRQYAAHEAAADAHRARRCKRSGRRRVVRGFWCAGIMKITVELSDDGARRPNPGREVLGALAIESAGMVVIVRSRVRC